jgi:hypothetical protein
MLLRRTGFAATLTAGVLLLAGGLQGVVKVNGPLEVARTSHTGQYAGSTGQPPAMRDAANWERPARDRGDCPRHRT